MHGKRMTSLFVLVLLVFAMPLSLAQQDVDVLFDLSKEHDATYGNPIVQSDRLCSALADDGISYGFIEEDEILSLERLSQARIVVIWDPDEMQNCHNDLQCAHRLDCSCIDSGSRRGVISHECHVERYT